MQACPPASQQRRHVAGLRQAGQALRRKPFAPVNVENAVVAQEGDLLLLTYLFVLLLNELPEDHHAGLLALLDIAAFLLMMTQFRYSANAQIRLFQKEHQFIIRIGFFDNLLAAIDRDVCLRQPFTITPTQETFERSGLTVDGGFFHSGRPHSLNHLIERTLE